MMHLQAVVDGSYNRLCAFDTLRVVVGASGGINRLVHISYSIQIEPCNRTDAHSRSVAVTIIRLRILAVYPLGERTAIAPHRIRIAVTPLMQRFTKIALLE